MSDMVLENEYIYKHFPALELLDTEDISISYENTESVCYDEKYHRLTDEKYILDIHTVNGRKKVTVRCSGEKSAFYALCDLAHKTKHTLPDDGVYVCAPAFQVRGYIEGFYGKPWSFSQRMDIMRLMANHRMNTVYYAPKDDIYHREKWREPYPMNALDEIRVLSENASGLFMDFYWCIAPGLDILYSNASETERIIQKYTQLYNIGIRRFGLLLDDIGDGFYYKEDEERFAEPVNAHIDLINNVYDALQKIDGNIKLTVCPTLYCGEGNEYYISKLGKNLPAVIDVFWTGRDICSRYQTSADALKFFEHTDHKPLYWDNYPVNDEGMHFEMHLGPIIGRDAELPKYARGLISNCMEYAECSKIPLITVADYLWDGDRYSPEDSWKKAIDEVIGHVYADAFKLFADHLKTSCLMDDNSSILKSAFCSIARAVREHKYDEAASVVNDYTALQTECLNYLRKNLPICGELRAWTEKYTVAAKIIKLLFNYLTDVTPSLKQETEALLSEYNMIPEKLIEDIVFREVIMNRY